MRRIKAFCLAVLLAVTLAAGVSASGYGFPSRDVNSYVVDEVGVISSETRNYIDSRAGALDEACGAQIMFVIVDFTGSYEIDDYAYELFNTWGVGSKSEDNGILYVLAVGAEDYYVTPGEGLTRTFTGGTLQRILDDYMEPDFAAGDYDAAVRKTFDRTYEIFEGAYNVVPESPDDEWDDPYSVPAEQSQPQESGFWHFARTAFGVVALIVIALAFFLFIGVLSRDRSRSSYGGGSSGFMSGLFLGSMLNRQRYRRPPPPPPPPGGPMMGGPRPGGFTRPRTPPRSGGGLGGFGGFGGGSTRGGGAGRSGFSGGRPSSGFSSRPSGGSRGFGGFGGGSTRGGGAGRRH